MPDRASDLLSSDAEMIGRMPFFAAAGAAATARLLGGAVPRALARGTVLVEQGGEAELLHLVLAGSLALRAAEEGAGTTVIEILGPGEIIPIAAALLHQPCPTSAVLLCEGRVLSFPAAALRAGMAEDAALASAAAALLSGHWQRMAEQLTELKLRDAQRRVAKLLARRLPAARNAGLVDLPEPRSALAAWLGMTPESLSRTLHALAGQGLLRLRGRRVEVVDRAALLAGHGTSAPAREPAGPLAPDGAVPAAAVAVVAA